MKKDNKNLTQGQISTHIQQIALPASIGFFFNTMFNVVDTYYAGQLSDHALAALSLSFPVFMLILSISVGIGTATTALIGNAIGSDKNIEAKYLYGQCLSLGIYSSVLVTILGLTLSKTIFIYLGASDNYLNYATEYTNILFECVSVFIIIQICSSVLSAYGDTKKNRNFLIFSFFLNLILDPILMNGHYGFPKLGIKGIALATVITQIIGIPYFLYEIKKIGGIGKLEYRILKPNLTAQIKILGQAIPAGLNMMTVALGFFVTTYFVGKFGHQAVAAFGVATRIEQIVLLPAIGLNIACLSLVSQNNGAEYLSRVKVSYYLCLKYGLSLMLVGSVVTFFFAESIIKAFSDSTQAIKIGSDCLKIESIAFVAYSTLYISTSALQGLKKPIFAVWMGISRQIVLPFLFIYISIEILNYGIISIWYTRLIITSIAALISMLYVRKTLCLVKY